jgi:hypothetical protein
MMQVYETRLECLARYFKRAEVLDAILNSHLELVYTAIDEDVAHDFLSRAKSDWKMLPSPYGSLMVCDAFVLIQEDDNGDWEILDWRAGE